MPSRIKREKGRGKEEGFLRVEVSEGEKKTQPCPQRCYNVREVSQKENRTTSATSRRGQHGRGDGKEGAAAHKVHETDCLDALCVSGNQITLSAEKEGDSPGWRTPAQKREMGGREKRHHAGSKPVTKEASSGPGALQMERTQFKKGGEKEEVSPLSGSSDAEKERKGKRRAGRWRRLARKGKKEACRGNSFRRMMTKKGKHQCYKKGGGKEEGNETLHHFQAGGPGTYVLQEEGKTKGGGKKGGVETGAGRRTVAKKREEEGESGAAHCLILRNQKEPTCRLW